MTDPFAAARHAVAAGRPRPAFTPNVLAVAAYSSPAGGLVATFPATAYPRWLDYMAVQASVVGPVHIHIGAISPASRITSHGDGSLADYSPPTGRYVPGGAPVIVLWETTDATATATANAQFREAR